MLMPQVVLRRGGRADRSREVHMPVSESVAAAIAAKAAQEARERDQLKRLILQVCNRPNLHLLCVAACVVHRCMRSLHTRS